jgi:hypothetical protein
LSTGSSQFCLLCYIAVKSKSRFKVQHVVKRPKGRRGRHLMRLRALQSQNPQVWCSFAMCKDKMDLWVTDSRLLVTENSWGAGAHRWIETNTRQSRANYQTRYEIIIELSVKSGD